MNHIAPIIHLSFAHNRGILGQNICVACLDTGIYAQHPDFLMPTSRVVGFYDAIAGLSMPYDDNGHGTHVAGILAGSGTVSNGRYTGVAPACNLVSVKILNRYGDGFIKDFERGIDWILKNIDKYQIRIVNISIGSVKEKEFQENSEFVRKVETLWDAGLVVVCAAGNEGPRPGTIGAPGNSRKIITVGSSDEAGKKAGSGPTAACIKKPDIVAPGSNIRSCIPPKRKKYYDIKSGTSMSTPIVSGAIALLLSRYPDMSNLEVKIRLKNTAVSLGQPHNRQGWGMIDIQQLLTHR